VDIKELQSYLNPPLLAIHSAFHQQAADELGRNLLGGAGEEGLRECWEGLGGYRSGLEDGQYSDKHLA